MTAQTGPPPSGHNEPCEECGAALDPQQRYCVECAARRGNGANPASRYFAAMSKRARRPAARPAAKTVPGSRAAAVGFFALLPIAVAIGVVVGRGGSDGGENEALRNQNAAVASQSAGGSATASARVKPGESKQADKAATRGAGKVVAKTSNGTVHQVTGYKPSAKKTQEDTKLVEKNVDQTGSTYIEAQQNLPDVIVVGGDPGSAAAPTSGSQP